ncbi:hypothetical protein QTO34_019367 [Cnephaeus nilssonii]|uniref:Uncharacterized protein n=1 Tax=Cnephaeus nilssonii TaxID=3371016 RepID=A0AA40HWK9_CNENI|nr:hypothetical protein QTO34_019367 [Eptesicus nilssonii]
MELRPWDHVTGEQVGTPCKSDFANSLAQETSQQRLSTGPAAFPLAPLSSDHERASGLPEKVRAFLKRCKQDSSALHTGNAPPEGGGGEGSKSPPAIYKTKSEENIEEEKRDIRRAGKHRTEKPSREESDLETDSKGVLGPDTTSLKKWEVKM